MKKRSEDAEYGGLSMTLAVRRLGYALGAEITGVDLAGPLDDATIAEIRRVWLENIVLCFPGQHLDPHSLLALCSRFGEIDDMRRSPQDRHPQHSNLHLLRNPTNPGAYPPGGEWHSDQEFGPRPASGSFLFSLELPDIGGDTMFTNMYMAYETLSPKMKSIIDLLETVHDITATANFTKKAPEVQAHQRKVNPPTVQPVVRVHPETGRKSLFLGTSVRNFLGMTEEETKPLFNYLMEHAIRYEFIYRHRWTLGDMLVWDNRCAMHRVAADHDPRQTRRMLRCALLAPKSGRYLDPEPEEANSAASLA